MCDLFLVKISSICRVKNKLFITSYTYPNRLYYNKISLKIWANRDDRLRLELSLIAY